MNIQQVTTGWNFMRWLRLGIGLLIATQAIQMHDLFSGFIAAFFLFQAVTNTGCCGVNGCTVKDEDYKTGNDEEITFEEIKTK